MNEPTMPAANPARLQRPWNVAMMLLPYAFSTPTACVFTERLCRLAAMPRKKSMMAKTQTAQAGISPEREKAKGMNPRQHNEKGYSMAARSNVRRLVKRSTIYPATGTPSNCPKGKAKRSVPSCPSLKAKMSLKSGMRAAQLAKVNPCKKKNVPMEIRYRTFGAFSVFSSMTIPSFEFAGKDISLPANGPVWSDSRRRGFRIHMESVPEHGLARMFPFAGLMPGGVSKRKKTYIRAPK